MQSANSKPLIFVTISVLVVALIYVPAAVFDLYASPMIGRTFKPPLADERITSPQTGGVFSESPTDEGQPPADDGTAELMGPYTCEDPIGTTIPKVKCCAVEHSPDGPEFNKLWCTTCDATNPPSNCSPREEQIDRLGKGTVPFGGTFEEQPSGPAIPPGGGVLETPSAPPRQGDIFNTPQTGGVFNALPPPTEEGTQPPTLTEEPATGEEEPQVPVCEEGLEFNYDLGFCVPTECPEGQELNEETGICVLEEQPVDQQQEQTVEEPEEQQQQIGEEPEQQPTEEEGGNDDDDN